MCIPLSSAPPWTPPSPSRVIITLRSSTSGRRASRSLSCAAAFYLHVLRWIIGSDGVIRGPGGNGRLAPVARDDMADTVAAVITADGVHDGRTYEVTGADLQASRLASHGLSRSPAGHVWGRRLGLVEVDPALLDAQAGREMWLVRNRLRALDRKKRPRRGHPVAGTSPRVQLPGRIRARPSSTSDQPAGSFCERLRARSSATARRGDRPATRLARCGRAPDPPTVPALPRHRAPRDAPRASRPTTAR